MSFRSLASPACRLLVNSHLTHPVWGRHKHLHSAAGIPLFRLQLPESPDVMSRVSPGHLTLPSLLTCILLMAEFCQELLVYLLNFLLGLLDMLLIGLSYSWTWRWKSLKINQVCWITLLFRTLSPGILPSRSLKSLNLTLLKARVVILLVALLPPLRILNSTISQLVQPVLTPTSSSL